MNRLSRLVTITTALAVCLTASPLFAQEPVIVVKKGYSLAYAITGLCVMLGVLVICRPIRVRAEKIERPGPEDE